jgi:hypothetical protein
MVTSTNCFSLGEAMRNLDQRDIIKGTFILLTGELEGAGRGGIRQEAWHAV